MRIETKRVFFRVFIQYKNLYILISIINFELVSVFVVVLDGTSTRMCSFHLIFIPEILTNHEVKETENKNQKRRTKYVAHCE